MSIKLKEKNFEIHRGINDLSDIKRIEDDHLYDLENFDYVPVSEGRVQIEMRGGTSKDTMTGSLGASAIYGMVVAEFTAGPETVFSHGTEIYELASTPVATNQTQTASKMHSFAMLEDKLLIANGTDVVLEKSRGEDPTTLGGSPPVFKYLHTWHNFVFGAGITGFLSRLQWCNLGNKDIWTGTDLQDQPFGEITGINSLRDEFFIFGKNAIRVVVGYTSSNFIFKDFSTNVGCISHYGIVSNGATLFFPSYDGIYALGSISSTDKVVGGSSLVKLSQEKIKTFWDTLDHSTIGLIHGVHDPSNHSIRWSVRRQGETYNDREIVFDYHENVMGFRKTRGRNISCYGLGRDSVGKWEVKYGDSTKGMIYKMNPSSTTDDGTAITGTAITKAYDFDRPDIAKRWNTISILCKGTASETPLYIHYGVGDFPEFENMKLITTAPLPVWNTFIWNVDPWGEDVFKNYPVGIWKMGKSLVLKFISGTSGKGIKIAGWQIAAQPFEKKLETDN